MPNKFYGNFVVGSRANNNPTTQPEIDKRYVLTAHSQTGIPNTRGNNLYIKYDIDDDYLIQIARVNNPNIPCAYYKYNDYPLTKGRLQLDNDSTNITYTSEHIISIDCTSPGYLKCLNFEFIKKDGSYFDVSKLYTYSDPDHRFNSYHTNQTISFSPKYGYYYYFVLDKYKLNNVSYFYIKYKI